MIQIILFLMLMCSPAFAEVDAMPSTNTPQDTAVLNENLRQLDARLRSASGLIAGIIPIDLTADVTGILPIANGGTGSSVAPDLTHSRLYTTTADFTVPSGITQVFVSCVGGGGGGGASGSGTNDCGDGGKKGAISQTFAIPVTASSVHTVTIGDGGTAGTSGGNGGTGGASWFSTTNFTGTGGAGGVGTCGGACGCSGNNGFAGQDSFYGTGGVRGTSGTPNAGNASGYSAGGGGAGVPSGNGGTGSKGFCSVIW